MYPDYGEMLWQRGFRGELHLMGVGYRTLMDYGDTREVTGVIYGDTLDESFCLTVRTKQKRDAVLDHIAQGAPFKGKLTPDLVRGDSGERYRLIVGRFVDGPRLG